MYISIIEKLRQHIRTAMSGQRNNSADCGYGKIIEFKGTKVNTKPCPVLYKRQLCIFSQVNSS